MCTHTQAISHIRDKWSFFKGVLGSPDLGRFIFSFFCGIFSNTLRIYPTLMVDKWIWIWSISWMETEGRKLKYFEIPHGPPLNLIQAYTVRNWWLNAWAVAQPPFIIEILNVRGLFEETSCIYMTIDVHFVNLFLWLWFFFMEIKLQCNTVFACAQFYGKHSLP